MGGSRGGVRSALGEAETGERSARQQKGKWEPALPRIGARGGRSGQRVGSGAPGRTRRSSTGAPAARRRQCRRRGTDLPPGRQTRARGFTGAQKQLCNRRGVDREGSRARQIGRATRWAQRRRGDGERARGGGGGGRHPRAGELPALATPWRGSALPAPPSPPPKSPAGSYTTLDWGARARAPGSTAPRASVAPPWGAPHGLDAGSACNFPRGGGGAGGQVRERPDWQPASCGNASGYRSPPPPYTGCGMGAHRQRRRHPPRGSRRGSGGGGCGRPRERTPTHERQGMGAAGVLERPLEVVVPPPPPSQRRDQRSKADRGGSVAQILCGRDAQLVRGGAGGGRGGGQRGGSTRHIPARDPMYVCATVAGERAAGSARPTRLDAGRCVSETIYAHTVAVVGRGVAGG